MRKRLGVIVGFSIYFAALLACRANAKESDVKKSDEATIAVERMSSAEVAYIDAAAEAPRKDNSFKNYRKKKGKKSQTTKTTTTARPTTTAKSLAENEASDEEAFSRLNNMPVAIGIESPSIFNTNNGANGNAATFDPIVGDKLLNKLTEDATGPSWRNRRSADYVGSFLVAESADEPSESVLSATAGPVADTAPPDLADLVNNDLFNDDDVLKQIRAGRLRTSLTHSSDDVHRGGNVPTVKFEDALKVTVPYEKAKAKA